MKDSDFVKSCEDAFNQFKGIKDGGEGSGIKGHKTTEEKQLRENARTGNSSGIKEMERRKGHTTSEEKPSKVHYNDKKYVPINKNEVKQHQKNYQAINNKIAEFNDNRERMITTHMKKNNIKDPAVAKEQLLKDPNFQKILKSRKDLRNKRDDLRNNLIEKHGFDLEGSKLE